MRTKSSNFFVVFLLVIVASVAMSQTTAQTVRKSFNIGFLTDIVGINDSFYNELSWRGIVALDASNFAIGSIDYYEPQSAEEYLDIFREVSIYENRDIIVISSPQLRKALYTVANENPDKTYINIDGIVDNSPNVANAIFSTEQGSFIVGFLAGLKTQADGLDTVGYIGDVDTKERQKYESGFEQGVKAVDKSFKLDVVYLDERGTDTRLAEKEAREMFTNGVSVIYNAAGFPGAGIFKVAKEITRVYSDEEKRKLKEEERTYLHRAWVIGSDKDQFNEGIYSADASGVFLSLSVTLTSMIKRYDIATYDMLAKTYNFAFPAGQVIYYSLTNGGVGIPDNNPNLTFPYADELKAVLDPVVAGEVTVSKTPTRILSSFQ